MSKKNFLYYKYYRRFALITLDNITIKRKYYVWLNFSAPCSLWDMELYKLL